MDFSADIGIPPRSVLVRPEPKGKGTDQIESLSSYLSHVVKLHGRSLGQMIWHYIPEIRACGKDSRGLPLMCLRSEWVLNTPRLVKTFSELTLRNDLGHLTFDAWEKVISARGFFSHHQKWCPQCLAENPYERLAWTTEPVQCCTVHGTRLKQACSSCHRPAYRRVTRSPWLHCPFCGFDRKDDKRVVAATKEEIWTTRQILRLITVEQNGIDPENTRALQIWFKLIRPHFPTHRDAARFLGLHTNPRTMFVGRECLRYSIKLWLRLCACLRLDLDKLLLEDIGALKPRFCRAAKTFGGRRLTRDEIAKRITVALSAPVDRPFNLVGLMRRVGINKLTLRNRAPEIYEELLLYFKQRRKEDSLEAEKQRLFRAVKFLRKHGPTMSNRAVASAVGFARAGDNYVDEARRLAFSLKNEPIATKEKFLLQVSRIK